MTFRSSSSNILSATTATTSSTTIPAGVQAGDRVYAFVGSGATSASPVTPPAGWTQLGSTFAPTSNLTSAVFYRDVANAAEAGTTVSWTWSGSASRTWAILLAYSGLDARAPLVNAANTSTSSAGPFIAPTLVVPSADWLITFAAGRESPGTDTAKSWTISPATDAERVDDFTSQVGTGQKFVLLAADSAGPLTTTGGGTGGASVGPQAPPTNTYNALVTAPRTMLIGATVKKEDLDYWQPKLAGLDWMRIFPNADGLPPDWTDSRFTFVRGFGGQPFISSKVDGDSAALTKLSNFLVSMRTQATWIYNHPDPNKFVWITDRHEPEGDVTASQYQANFTAFYNMIQALPADVRARVQAGPVLTRQYTENTAGRSYATYDPGIGDFFGVDMYANSWGSPSTDVATGFPNAVTFLSKVKAYQKTGSDHRPRIFPELGAIGIPVDTDGTMRAQWIKDVFAEINTWSAGAQGWSFGGALWWLAEGKSGTSLNGAGTKRWFQFDRRHTGTDGSYVIIPSVAPASSGGSTGSTATSRTVSTSVPVNVTHVWSVTVPQIAPVVVDPSTVNAWSYLGLPQR